MTARSEDAIYMSKPIRWSLAILAMTIGVNVLAWLPSLQGAEKLWPVQILLPWACVVAARSWTPIFLSLECWLEWPLYGLLWFVALKIGRQREALIALSTIHLVGCVLCFTIYRNIPIGFPDL